MRGRAAACSEKVSRLSDKPYLLFSTPRSGSNLVYDVLEQYFKSARGFIGLGEYFTHVYQSFWDTGNGLASSVFPSERVRHVQVAGSYFEAIRRQRLAWLKKYHGRYFFKLTALQVSGESYPWLIENYNWILIERRNLFDQLLSYLISVELNRWYGSGGLGVTPGSITARPEHADAFTRMILEYRRIKAELQDPAVLVYEDVVAGPIAENILRLARLDNSAGGRSFRMPPKQNPENKLPLFTNPDEVLKIYETSALNELVPLNACLSRPFDGRTLRAPPAPV
ncbi:MAG TPA: hypothetical protein VFV50_04175 [Bdellovibrionales bacterium]|nr:hypothetical protein [Bdellovibrionales bacterium]